MDEFPDVRQVMIVVFGDKIQVVHQPHRLLQARVEHGESKQIRLERPQSSYEH